MVLYSFYVQILPTNLISSLNLEVLPKVKISALIGLNEAFYKSRKWPKHGENEVFKAEIGIT